MASIVWADVIGVAPELSTVSSLAQTDILAHVNVALNVANFGGEAHVTLRLARIYMAAHMGTFANTGVASGGPAGPVVAEEVGDLKTQYGFSPPGAGELWDTTTYGKLFRNLCRMSPARAPINLT